jgi:hypothetical protein
MFRDAYGNTALTVGEAEFSYWRERVKSQRTAVDKAQADLADAEHKLQIAESFVQLLRERYGLRVEAEPSRRFERVPLGEAALTVIREKGRIAPYDLIAELQAGGFQFGDHPLRQLHAALIHQKKQVVKDEDGSWGWAAAHQRPLPLETKGKEVSGEE